MYSLRLLFVLLPLVASDAALPASYNALDNGNCLAVTSKAYNMSERTLIDEAYKAVTAAWIINVRICLESGREIFVSPTHILQCSYNKVKDYGNGDSTQFFDQIYKNGVVTEECQPWNENAQECVEECVNGNRGVRVRFDFKSEETRNRSQVFGSEQLKDEVYHNGPVFVIFLGKADLLQTIKSDEVYHFKSVPDYREFSAAVVGWGEGYFLVQLLDPNTQGELYPPVKISYDNLYFPMAIHPDVANLPQ